MRNPTKTVFLILSLSILAGCQAWQVRNAMDYAVDVSGQALVEVYKVTYAQVGSPEGTDMLCKGLVDKHKDEIAAGTYTEQMLKDDCAKIISDFEAKFDKSLNASSHALLVLENALYLWGQGESLAEDQAEGKKITIYDMLDFIPPILDVFRDTVEFLRASGVTIPKKLDDAISLMSGLTGQGGK